ncbi:MAG: hypothetical protein JW955_24535 [Sedimentisphaerales bacterium]|nr:hypothetical protein [Sedimentisphaerales bacterium]
MERIVVALVLSVVVAGCAAVPGGEKASSDGWMQDFGFESRTLAPTGEGRYVVLRPGFQLVLEGGGERVVITVLDQTERVGGVTTRVVEERETKDGRLAEVSRNYFAIDPATGDVFYFGEAVDDYKDDRIVGHGGAWRSDEKGFKPGLIVPGHPVVGAKYYQEIAPGKAMDRAENLSTSVTLKTPAGLFTDCLKTEETSPLEAGKSYKTYAPGIGLIQDEGLLLTHYGYVK